MNTLALRIHNGFDAVERKLAQTPVWLLAVAILLAFQFFLIWTHEAWADEWQALLIAIEAPDNATMLAWLRYEGHPPLWYWMLRGLGALTEQHIVLPLAATLCALVAQGAILFGAPFTRLERLLVASSQYVLFEFLTISRGTSLGVALVLLALVVWRSRWVWLIFALLPMVDFLFGVLSGIFAILKWREKDLWWPGVALWLAGSAFAGWSVLPADDMVSAFQAVQRMSGMELMMEIARGWVLRMGSMLVPFQGGIIPQWNSPVIPMAEWSWVIFLLLCWVTTRTRPWHVLMLFGFIGFTLAFSLAVYPIGLRHIMFAALLLIGLVWLARSDGDPPQAPFRAWIAVAAISGIATGIVSYQRDFDSAHKVVDLIEERGLSDKHWIALPEWRVPAIAGRTDMVFGRPAEDCVFRFIRWDHRLDALTDEDTLAQALEQEVAKHGRSYLLTDLKLLGFDRELVEELETIPEAYNGIVYHLYVIGPQAPEKQVELPFCYDL